MFDIYFVAVQIRRFFKWFLTIQTERKLKQERKEQIESYKNISYKFKDLYDSIKHLNIKEFMTEPWFDFTKKVEKAFYPKPSFDFLNNPIILLTMFATAGGKWLRKQLDYLESKYENEQLKYLLKEDYIGRPLLLNKKYLTSHNLIHHAYSIVRYFDKTNSKISQINAICEWGGGYGSMCRLFYRFISPHLTYVLIDIPVFCALQWLYLSIIFGEDKINLILNKDIKIKDGKINILPVGIVADIDINSDLFVSTWALSESTDKAQDFVLSKNFFNSRKILISHQLSDKNFKYANRLKSILGDKEIYTEEIEFLPKNYYIFK